MSLRILVIDASAALHAAASEEGFADYATATLVAPALLWSECTSVLREMQYRGEISAALKDAAMARLTGGPIRRRSPRRLYDEASRLAVELGWAKTYDAEYVALARMLAAPLLTRDARLVRGASRVLPAVNPDLQAPRRPAG
ncbi:MAG: type II toxin-antitoxin system VapC family toxin [Acidobacteria bacterium]|nr:type II toxin-antitoxin system VapC family toxin [Acidobacteriota bacterium]